MRSSATRLWGGAPFLALPLVEGDRSAARYGRNAVGPARRSSPHDVTPTFHTGGHHLASVRSAVLRPLRASQCDVDRIPNDGRAVYDRAPPLAPVGGLRARPQPSTVEGMLTNTGGIRGSVWGGERTDTLWPPNNAQILYPH